MASSDAIEQQMSDQIKFLRLALLVKGQHPKANRNRERIISEHNDNYWLRKAHPVAFEMRASFTPPAYPPCTRSLHDLSKVMIKNLYLETHHRGTYVVLRTVTPPDHLAAVACIVEDETQDVIRLNVNFQDRKRDIEEAFPQGIILIVKEPYLSVMGEGTYGIRVDHLSDVVYLPAHDERVPESWRLEFTDNRTSAGAWKKKGNNHFSKSEYHLAIDCYTKGLSCISGEETYALHLNRSLAFLKIESFDAAFSDVESAINSRPTEKAQLRKAQVLYNVQKYHECRDVLEALLKEDPTNSATKDEHTRAIDRIKEKENGIFPFKQLQLDASIPSPPQSDHSTYIGPVTVRKSGTRGRGLFTTQEVKAGDLLLCEKAFAYAFRDPRVIEHKDLTVMTNVVAGLMTMGAQADLIDIIVRKLHQNPSLIRTFTDLHRGSFKPVVTADADGTPLVDSFLIERIIQLNCFACPPSSLDTHKRVKRKEEIPTNAGLHSAGLWSTISLLNHACASNTQLSFIGDMMVIRASQDLGPDTEINFWYKQLDPAMCESRSKKFKHWGFECDCAICQDHEKTKAAVLWKRKNLRDAIEKHLDHKGQEAKIEIALDQLADTYTTPAPEVPRVCIWELELQLAERYAERKKHFKAVEYALRALGSLGYVVEGGNLPRSSEDANKPLVIKHWGLIFNSLIECWMLLAGAYRLVAPDLEAQAKDYAKVTYKICIGEDETFEEMYGPV